MTETAQMTEAQKDELLEKLLKERAGGNGHNTMQPASGMAAQFQQKQQTPQGALPEARALLVPLEMINSNGGRCEVYLEFDPSYSSDIDSLLRHLSSHGVPLKIWKPKNGGNNAKGYNPNGNGNGGGGGGW